MAFFKFRKGSDDAPATTRQAESLDVLRRRARHRLIGAAILVLAGVVGFPMVFDNQPRPISVDIPIEIPDKAKARPLPSPAPKPAAAASAVSLAQVTSVPESIITEPHEPVAHKNEEKVALAPVFASSNATKNIATPAPKPDVSHEAKPADKPSIKPAADAKAQALLDANHSADKKDAASDGRFVVQVGAFSDNVKAHGARVKVERAGLKTYTQEVQAKDGPRIRVRVGPFASKAEAEKAAEKIKKLDLPAAILSL